MVAFRFVRMRASTPLVSRIGFGRRIGQKEMSAAACCESVRVHRRWKFVPPLTQKDDARKVYT